MGNADIKLQWHPVIHLSKMRGEELKSISSKGSAQQPRTSTPKEGVCSRAAETESMEVDTPAVHATYKDSSASVVAHSAMRGASALQAHPKSAGLHYRQGPKMKHCAMTQQGFFDIVAGVLAEQGMSQEDWEQSLSTDYRVDPLPPPERSVSVLPGQHLSTLEGASVDQWRPEPDITPDNLLRQLTRLTQGTSQACRYYSLDYSLLQA